MKTINKKQALDLIQQSNGKTFSVIFTKKDKTKRLLNGRTGVKKGVKGTGMAYNPLSKGLLPIYDMQKKGFRMINLETIEALKINKTEYIVSDQVVHVNLLTKLIESFKLIFQGEVNQ